ncbi:MAG: DUF6069 family protein [Bacteroidia bacterium]|jgi:hypothetical protein|nr:DUF6069 family protein [Bacteroidia bacterium]
MKTTASKILTNGGLSVLAATVLNVILFYIFKAMGGFPEDFLVPQAQNQPITVVPVIISSVITAVVGMLIYLLLNRFSGKAQLIFRIIAVVVFVLFIYTPLSIPNAPGAMVVGLELMHLVSAAVVTWFLTVRAHK